MPLGDDFLLGGFALGLVFATLAVIAFVRRRRTSRIVIVNAGVAVGFAALVRRIDPLARPWRGEARTGAA